MLLLINVLSGRTREFILRRLNLISYTQISLSLGVNPKYSIVYKI